MTKRNSMETGLILTAGTTAEPLIKAVEEAAQEDVSFVYIIYGRPFPNQSPNPFDIAHEVKKKASTLSLRVQTFEIPDPEDFDSCLETISGAITRINEDNLVKLIGNFTGGTKPMSAALINGLLTEPISAEVILDYTGGIIRNEAGRVISGAMRVKRHHESRAEKTAREALNLLKAYQYSHAYFTTRSLPEVAKFGFLKMAIEAIYLWDNFLYDESFGIIKRLKPSVRFLKEDELLKDITGIIDRMAEIGNSITKAIRSLLKLQAKEDIPKTLKEVTPQELYLIPADSLENARRRFVVGNYTDAVLRAYRAVESATQIRLILSDINPWNFTGEEIDEQKRKVLIGLYGKDSLPSKIVLSNGLTILKVLNKDIPEELQNPLKEIQ